MGQDTKRLITGMIVALAVLFAWQSFVQWMYPKAPLETASTSTTQSAPATTGTTTSPSTTQAASGAATNPVATSMPWWHARADGGGVELTTLGSGAAEDKSFEMAVEIFRKGAAINSVVLNRFKKTAEDAVTRYTFQEPYKVDGAIREDSRSLMTRSITVDGHLIDLSDLKWKLESADAASARFSVDIFSGDAAVLRVIKTYALSPKSDDPKTPQGYEVRVSHRLENLSDRPVVAKLAVNGPTAPPRELERQPDQNLIFGYWNAGRESVVAVSHLMQSEFNKDTVTKDFTKGEKGYPVLWFGAQSAYFNAIIRPIPGDAKEATANWMAKESGELLNPTAEPDFREVELKFETTDQTLAAKEARQFDMDVYFGPKGRKVLKTEYYASLPRGYDNTLVITGGWCGICTFQWLINVLVWMLTGFHFLTHDWGLAIICLVLLVRACLHPVTKKAQVNMMKMQKMGPELEKLKKKYGDDKEGLAKAQMQFYRTQGAGPILGCLPMLLQMPIWIALWNSLQSTFELRHSPFLYGFTWIKDLAKPDYLIKFTEPVHLLFGFKMTGLHVLPLLLAVVFYLQQKMTPKPPAATPEQAQQQKMMTWMSTLMFPLFLYSGPSGLNLYIMTSTGFGILESKVIRKHIKEREELEKLGPTIIDAPPPGKESKKKVEAKKGFMERLAEKAEELKRESEKKRR